MEADGRPDPDALLERVQQQEARARRGKLKVFFGFAPGVGKTYRMLQAARELVSDRHFAPGDVVVGIVETHGRYDTEGQVLGLELLPRKKVEYRGRVLEEFDLELALARKPRVLLVDELAHTNAPGSRHARRWQDVEELLEAGIDVFTTVNVQHVESLNDVIAQITHVQVRETVPDAVLDRADTIELVDISPEELLQRLAEGKVYLPEQARRAADHFFRRGNLLALRELALRRTAQHVDEDVREYREEHGVSTTWPASERILVCVGPAPSSARLIRAAARMAAGLRCPWVAAWVDTPATPPLNDADRTRLEEHLRAAEASGATVARLAGPRPADALLAYARKHNVTRIVVGKPTHSRLRDRLRGSFLDEIVRGSGEIDVHVISGDERPPDQPRPTITPVRAPPRAYGLAVLTIAATLGLSLLLRATFALPDLEMLFLLAVMAIAARFGRGPALVGAALAVGCYDFFFVPPYFTFSVDDRRYFLTFAMMFGVGLVMSELVGRLRRQEQDALARAERTAGLYALTRDLASVDTTAAIASVAAGHASDFFHCPASVLGWAGEAELTRLDAAQAPALEPRALGVARWAAEHGALAGVGTDTLPGAPVLCAPLRTAQSTLGVLVLEPPGPLTAEQLSFLDLFARQLATALERVRLSSEARAAALRARTEEMRASLLSTVSHDLRTPLASITGAATALRDEPKLSEQTRAELVDSVIAEAERLERLVANLLDMTRLDAGAVSLKREWVPLDELIGSALTRLEPRLEARKIAITVAPEIPLLSVDPVLIEQLLVNLLENADKYTPPGSPLDLEARVDDGQVSLTLADRGPGLPPDAERRIFEKFFRGTHPGTSGAGLGLAICKAIVDAHGGTISASNRPGGGAVFRITLPVGGSPPAVLPVSEASS
ncbi:MAG: DUF4118 domain-containing protein [Myxococcota bacterium]